ncbi:hypothetical protein [Demequina salsinemoris]|uniref:hypothetical protein n=1 Tax=Demequina salsinemoris TaxID=577470 RepID=UPI00128DBCDC|nr:hypothetical protein [Demequina salsinemoris]
MSLVISGLAFTSASADETTESDFVVQEAVEASATGASDDAAAIAAAAEVFDADDSASAAELVEAASATDAVALEGTDDEASVETGTLQPVDVTVTDAGATMSDETGVELGISAVGDATESELVDGASVAQDVADGTDVVTRATEDGVQLVAVLEDAEAAASVDFALDIPEGAELVEQEDGSIDVVVEQQVEVADPADEARADAEVDALLDGVEDLDDLTDEQWAALDAIEPVATTTETVETTVASVAAPWAVDANGEALDTSYELDGSTLTQVIQTDDSTAFPVTADPAVWWWVATAATCAVQVAALVAPFIGEAKIAAALAKVEKIIASSARLKKAVDAIGGLKATLRLIKKAATGYSSMSKASKAQLAAVVEFGSNALSEWLGIGSCVSLIRAF